jgi:SAM-dependent methyltransferase
LTSLYAEHVDLYDRAFGWDIGEEVDWLLARLGPHCRSVLEPGCGTGRYLKALAERGIEAVGFDREPAMVEAAGRWGTPVLADMAAFDLGRAFGGAICPIGTLALLSPADAARHLGCMGAHLVGGARYLVQLAVHDPNDPDAAVRSSSWEREGVRIEWATEEVDLERGTERQRSRIEILDGPDAGRVVEEALVVTAWTPASWQGLVHGSPFDLSALYDGEQEGRPQVRARSVGRLLWHELERS